MRGFLRVQPLGSVLQLVYGAALRDKSVIGEYVAPPELCVVTKTEAETKDKIRPHKRAFVWLSYANVRRSLSDTREFLVGTHTRELTLVGLSQVW